MTVPVFIPILLLTATNQIYFKKIEEDAMAHAITMKELRHWMEDEVDFTLIDVLPKNYYRMGHIPGAISMTMEEMDEKAKSMFDSEKERVVYCASAKTELSHRALRKLTNMGFRHVYEFEGGIKDWKDGGMSLTGPGCNKPVCEQD